ncbi:MAG: site-2 protease family protein [Candidatus Thermoplasmatota archaeon]|nr:site-2 protease family protein [Candidatus Thermoplasmatota archaeon]
MANGLLIAIFALVAWLLVMAILAPKISKSKHFSLMGPILMIKAVHKRNILDSIARIVPKEAFSRLAVAIVIVSLIGAIALLLYEAYLTLFIRVAPSLSLGEYLVLPGINPYVPIFYGTFALVVSVVIHEIMHGVLSRKHGIKVNSVGALFLVIPLGAFVEPDQDEITKTDPVVRRRIFAAGPAINIILASFFFIILIGVMMPAAQPIHNGVYVNSVTTGSVAQISGITGGSEIVSFASYSGSNLSNIITDSTIAPGTVINYTSFGSGGLYHGTIPAGVDIAQLSSGYPAAASGMKVGEIFYKIAGQTVWNLTSLGNILDSIEPGTIINITAFNSSYSSGHWHLTYHNYTMKTASKWDYYDTYYPLYNSPSFKNESFIGVSLDYSGIGYISISSLTTLIFGASALQDFPNGAFTTIGLPFLGLTPVPPSIYYLYHTPIAPSIFWEISNTIFWLFWLNLLLGITNALPLFILDGGQFFKDTLSIASRRPRLSFLNEKRIKMISNAVGFIVFFLILWQLIVPRLL